MRIAGRGYGRKFQRSLRARADIEQPQNQTCRKRDHQDYALAAIMPKALQCVPSDAETFVFFVHMITP